MGWNQFLASLVIIPGVDIGGGDDDDVMGGVRPWQRRKRCGGDAVYWPIWCPVDLSAWEDKELMWWRCCLRLIVFSIPAPSPPSDDTDQDDSSNHGGVHQHQWQPQPDICGSDVVPPLQHRGMMHPPQGYNDRYRKWQMITGRSNDSRDAAGIGGWLGAVSWSIMWWIFTAIATSVLTMTTVVITLPTNQLR